MKSILHDEKRCYLCGKWTELERHHCLAGIANRKLSEKYGLWVYLCHECHVGKNGAQYEKKTGLRLKADSQRAFEKIHGHDAWMKVFGKNYL